MTILFRNETGLGKMGLCNKTYLVGLSWMSDRLGEGGEEIGNHGGSTANSFSQETEAKGQRSKPRMGILRSTFKRLKCRMHADTLTQLPFFFFSTKVEVSHV